MSNYLAAALATIVTILLISFRSKATKNPFLASPRLTILGKAVNALLTPLDYLAVGWQFARPFSLTRLQAQAASYAKLPVDFGSDDFDSSASDDR
jgi:hypothetical protein